MRSMIHPYWGYLVRCAELDGEQHRQHDLQRELCWGCNEELILSCPECKRIVECSACGQCHAAECPWPL